MLGDEWALFPLAAVVFFQISHAFVQKDAVDSLRHIILAILVQKLIRASCTSGPCQHWPVLFFVFRSIYY
jgi:hypothetical protein